MGVTRTRPSPESGHQTRQGGISALGQKRTSLAYSTTSSARESTSTGIVNPSARARIWTKCPALFVVTPQILMQRGTVCLFEQGLEHHVLTAAPGKLIAIFP